MVKQKYIVKLGERDGHEIWLAYNDLGRIGNARFIDAWKFDTAMEARHALAKVRRERRWPGATIFGTTVEVDE